MREPDGSGDPVRLVVPICCGVLLQAGSQLVPGTACSASQLPRYGARASEKLNS